MAHPCSLHFYNGLAVCYDLCMLVHVFSAGIHWFYSLSVNQEAVATLTEASGKLFPMP